MKIAVLGGGITGLTAAYYLAKDGHMVTLLEKEKVLGGLASGFKARSWNWHLERTYHHLFANDSDILNFAKEIKFDKIYFQKPITSSLFDDPDLNYRVLPLDTPLDLLRFPYLDLFNKLRAGSVIAFLKLSPFLPIFENMTAEKFLKKTMGNKVWISLWQTLFRKKFGEYAGIILGSFIWARIKKRTKALGYIKGGFQSFIDYIHQTILDLNVSVLVNYEVKEIKKIGKKFSINGKLYDRIISTLPTPVMGKLTSSLFSKSYLDKFNKIKYLHAITLILKTDKPIMNKTYWLNICSKKIPFMILAQHTNFVEKKYYGNKNISYVGWYVKTGDKLLNMKDQELVSLVLPHLKKISNFKFRISNFFVFKAPWAQPIFDKNFVENMPTYKTPDKNFLIANLDMTYPYDRGTNYAVKLGKDVSSLIK